MTAGHMRSAPRITDDRGRVLVSFVYLGEEQWQELLPSVPHVGEAIVYPNHRRAEVLEVLWRFDLGMVQCEMSAGS